MGSLALTPCYLTRRYRGTLSGAERDLGSLRSPVRIYFVIPFLNTKLLNHAWFPPLRTGEGECQPIG